MKSPLHSVLLGLSGLLFWTTQGEILGRLKSARNWLSILLGITVCLLGYLPPYLTDREAFIASYIVRETAGKGPSGLHWTVGLVSTFGFYLFPWILLAFTAYARLLISGISILREDPVRRRLILLSFSLFAPSVTFFTLHPYTFENYNLPVISGVFLLIATFWSGAEGAWSRLFRATHVLMATVALIFGMALAALYHRFAPIPWWPKSALILSVLFAVLAGAAFLLAAFLRRPERRVLAAAAAGSLLLVSVGFPVSVIGEFELLDLRSYLAQPASQGRRVIYSNIGYNMFNEAGQLSFFLGREVERGHSSSVLKDAFLNGAIVLVGPHGYEQHFREFAKKEFPQIPLKVTPWRRWLTRGKAPNGQPVWQEAWARRDLSLLQHPYWIMERADR